MAADCAGSLISGPVLSAPPAPAAPTAAQPGSLRRGDWRFLLPCGLPERVAYVGAPDTTLRAALSLSRPDVLVVGEAPRAPTANAFDLVVVAGAHPDALEVGAALLAPHGWLYAELDRFQTRSHAAQPAHAPRPARFRHPAELFRDLGLHDVSAYWHFPDFERCRCILPLAYPAACVRHLERDSMSPLVGLLGAAMALPGMEHALPRVVPCVSVIGRAPGATP
jgi:hypothetical protein